MAGNPAIQRVRAAEEAGDLWNQRILDYPVWPLERLRRYRLAVLDGDLGPVDGTGPSVVERLRDLERPLLKSLRDRRKGLPFSPQRDVWVLTTTNYRRRGPDGEFRCIFAEDLRRQLGDRLLFLERTTNDLDTPPRADTFDIDAYHITAMLTAKALAPVLAKARPLPPEQRRAFEPMSEAYVYQLAMYGRAMERIARDWIRRARPRAVFVLCAYQPFIPLQRALRAAGIPLVEIQHGIIHDSHPGYMVDDATDTGHRPDRIVVFGRYFGELLERESEFWRDRWVVGGHPWLRERVHASPDMPAKRDVIVFTQSDPPVRQRILGLLAELRAGLPAEHRIIIKPHPRERDASTFWRRVVRDGVELVSHTDDAYALLQRARVAVTVQSTVSLEALAFGCTSVVLRSPLCPDDVNRLAADGLIHIADDADDIVAALDSRPGARASALAQRLFAIQDAPLDYRALIEDLERGASHERSEQAP